MFRFTIADTFRKKYNSFKNYTSFTNSKKKPEKRLATNYAELFNTETMLKKKNKELFIKSFSDEKQKWNKDYSKFTSNVCSYYHNNDDDDDGCYLKNVIKFIAYMAFAGVGIYTFRKTIKF